MTIAETLAQFPKLAALVVGDICLDRWCTYDPAASEPSRETGIPRLGVVHTEVTPCLLYTSQYGTDDRLGLRRHKGLLYH